MKVKAKIEYELYSTHFKSKPYPISQNKCRNPAKKWYQMPQREKNIIIFPIIELKKTEKIVKVFSPKINEIKKPITINKLMINATPVILCNMESTEFNCGL